MRPLATLIWLLASLPVAVGAATARAALPADRRNDGAPLTLEQAVERVRQRFDARVVRAEELHEGAEVVYRIRLLAADGRVFTVRVNARSGAVQ